MTNHKYKIVLITSGQPSVNPRLVKEADALSEIGHEVTVIYQYWNDWATTLDQELISQKKWKSIRVGGDPIKEKITFLQSRLTHKIGQKLVKLFGFKNGFAELAMARCTFQLMKKAKNTSADLYIGHNLAALPAVVSAARKNNAKCGFDAEDLHRYEMKDDDSNNDVRLKRYIEEKYFPLVDYLTASSPQISKRYESFFPELKFTTLLNVFPKNDALPSSLTSHSPLKLFWFSQYIGLSRGLQDVIGALKELENEDIEFHILGFLTLDVKNEIDQIIADFKFAIPPKITFHPPISSSELFIFASKFHIGLATEPGFSINNDIALSNKIFTYMQAGLAIVASDTTAQKYLLEHYPNMGEVYEKKNPVNLAFIIKNYIKNEELLIEHQQQSFKYANEILNWEVEKEKFLSIIDQQLAIKSS